MDPNDIHYVAFSKQFRCKIWSGDKELIKGLAKKGFDKFITTDELFRWREGHEYKKSSNPGSAFGDSGHGLTD